MAMRYGDTTKWDGGWYRWLKPKMKCAWDFMTDKCDGVGTLRFDLKDISSKVCEEIDLNEFKGAFTGRVFWITENKIWIPGSFPFRNQKPSLKNRIQRTQIEKWLELSNQFPIGEDLKKIKGTYIELLGPSLGRGSDEAQASLVPASIVHSTLNIENRILNIEHRTLKGGVGEKRPALNYSARQEASMKFDFAALFDAYPRFEKKSASLAWMADNIQDQKTYDELKQSITNYTEKKKGQELEYIMTFPNFAKEWRDWLDPKAGTSNGPDPFAEIREQERRERSARGNV